MYFFDDTEDQHMGEVDLHTDPADEPDRPDGWKFRSDEKHQKRSGDRQSREHIAAYDTIARNRQNDQCQQVLPCDFLNVFPVLVDKSSKDEVAGRVEEIPAVQVEILFAGQIQGDCHEQGEPCSALCFYQYGEEREHQIKDKDDS